MRRASGELEAEVLTVLWAAEGPVTAAVVRDRVSGAAAYTTVLTILTRLCGKGLVARRRAGRAHLYAAVYDEAGVAAAGMRSLLPEGTGRAAVLARFISDLSPEDERLLERLLNGHERE